MAEDDGAACARMDVEEMGTVRHRVMAESESFESDVCYNMACLCWRLQDSESCRVMLLRCCVLASEVNVRYEDALSFDAVSKVVPQKCEQLFKSICADGDFAGVQSSLWFHEFFSSMGIVKWDS